ncbi:protein artichoke-like [Bradysia coprophila]|uniref:protein artichoke-like n=1 Tax=Bradysia coprophila TaxID=38358 RepID=UPI00187D8067|nr:protein artichoke-like [Bradysia coprophila]
MKTETVVVIITFQIFLQLLGSHCEKLLFRCDEIEANAGGPIVDLDPYDTYCSVTDFFVNYTTQVDCDVYPNQRAKVRVIKFYTSHLLYVPSGIFRYFSEVRDFDISKSEVVEIHRNSFEGANHLIYLTMSYNKIRELGPSLFIDATSLFVLDMSYNNITKIDKYAFVDARSVSRLSLSYNKLHELHQDLFRDLHFLDQIYLNDNEIETIHPLLFEYNYQLSKISLDNNRLHSFDVSMFKNFKYLDTLQFGGNYLSSFNSSAIGVPLKMLILSKNNLTELVVNKIDVLDASNNNLSSIRFTGQNTIKQLILCNNSITNIDNIVSQENLESLDLSFNNIGSVNITTFTKLKKLTILNLGNTKLNGLNFGTFSSQTELKVLDLSYNNLLHINFDIFSPYLTNIEKIFIEGNGLTEIADASHILNIFPVLNTVGLSNNLFNCSYLSGLLRAFRKFNIRLNLDPDTSNRINSTHVDGILCGNNLTVPENIRPMKHALVDNKDTNKVNGISDGRQEELTYLRSRLTEVNSHEQLLQSNLSYMKGLTAVVCSIALIYVCFKLVSLYLQHRSLQFVSPNVYRSTTTMNTLESHLDAS